LLQNPCEGTTAPYLKPVDTVVYGSKTLNREEVKLIQTPQLSKTSVLKKALKSDTLYTDERAAVEAAGGEIRYIPGSKESLKITHFEDLKNIPCLTPPKKLFLTGTGYDTHRLKQGGTMVLGGVKIDSPLSFEAHSDGDVLIHALIDALLGAAGFGDIGEFFPDTSETYKNADSIMLLKNILNTLTYTGYETVNADITVIAQTPKLSPYKNAIQKKLSKLLNAPVNIKATTNEKMGFIGRKEGVAVLASATLTYKDWHENNNR